ncbi:MAG: ferric reductase-like transmembrane domain-containing protein [Actinomycetota bacterium]|nr:ferric reductase-like transmembrane domain-containing protein [Actinomycetota bacterium]
MTWLTGDSPMLWYINRSTGLVLLVLFTLVTVLGVVGTSRVVPTWWARFATVDLHRRTALMAVVLLAVHVASAVLDGYVDIRLLDTWVPFQSSYRPVWMGLGTVALDLWLAVVVTSLLRRRMSLLGWKLVHLLAYLAWVPAVLHGFGTGTDVTQPLVVGLTFACVGAVVVAAAWRVAVSGLALPVRLLLGVAVVAAPVLVTGAMP